jgi:hypothetical protein
LATRPSENSSGFNIEPTRLMLPAVMGVGDRTRRQQNYETEPRWEETEPASETVSS